MSANFRLEPNGYLYLYHWINSDTPFKVSTKVKIKPGQWNKNTQQPCDLGMKDSKGVKVIDTLAGHRKALTDALIECKVTGNDLKATFHTKLSGKIIQSGIANKNFLDFYLEKIEQYKKENKSNWKNYRTTYNLLLKFFGRNRPSFDQINTQFYKDFTSFMEQNNLKVRSIATYWNNIKFICEESLEVKKSTNTDFREFKSIQKKDKYEEKVSIYLNLAELEKIYKLDFKNHPILAKTRDMFCIGANTGLRFSDWHKISSAGIKKDQTIIIAAKKTNIRSVIPCNKFVLEILEKYNGTLPKLTNLARVNKQLKIIGMTARLNELIEINPTIGGKRSDLPLRVKKWELLTTHTARRSLATNCILSGAKPYTVMKITGHKTIASLNKYINMDDEDALKELKALPMFSAGAYNKLPAKKRNKPIIKKSNINYLDQAPGSLASGEIL